MPTPKTQSDPWQEAAKGYQSQPQSDSAPAGNDDWKVWQQESAQPEQPGFFANLGHAFGIGKEELQDQQQHPIRHAFESYPPVAAAKGLYHGFMRSTGELGDALTAAEEKNPAGVGVHMLQAIPMVGAGLQKMTSELPPKQGAYDLNDITPGQVGTAIGIGAQVAPMLLSGLDMAMPGRGTIPTPGASMVKSLRDPMRAYRSPAISEPEAIARATADILKPNPSAYRSVVSGIQEHAPAIKGFADATGNKFKTPLDFAKAAQGAGQEATNFFKEHLVEPNAELQTPHGTVAEVYKRLGDINDELRPAYRQRTGGQELTALERKKLETERDALNESLYNTLSERSGKSVEDVRAINQRGGALQHIGDETDAAQAMRRSGFSGYTPTGLPIPMTMMERGLRLAQYLRGGPEAVAGRQLGRVFQNVTEPPPSLPDPESISAYRRMAEQSDLGHLRRVLENQEQNRANARMRLQENRTPAGTAFRKLKTGGTNADVRQ